jgi:hypothetical protein
VPGATDAKGRRPMVQMHPTVRPTYCVDHRKFADIRSITHGVNQLSVPFSGEPARLCTSEFGCAAAPIGTIGIGH